MLSARFLFRLAYRTLYFVVHLVLAALLLVSPADLVDQALEPSNRRLWTIWVVAVSCMLTLLLLVFVYALRLYANGSALAAIPKPWVPVEKGDLDRHVYRVVSAALRRSAEVAWAARPRERRGAVATADPTVDPTADATADAACARRAPVWGHIEHPGWASPDSADLPPSLQYFSVVLELPHLTEAKALTLVPIAAARPPPSSPSSPSSPSPTLLLPSSPPPQPLSMAAPNAPVFDAAAVALVQRAPHMSLRDYLAHLASVGVIAPGPAPSAFLALYEHARFSTRPVTGARFRDMMRLFAEVLRQMRPPGPAVRSPGGDDEASDEEARMGSRQPGGAISDPSDPSAPSSCSSFCLARSLDDDDGEDIDNNVPLAGSPSTPRSYAPASM